jgi:Cu/Ag efflux protein CusF
MKKIIITSLACLLSAGASTLALADNAAHSTMPMADSSANANAMEMDTMTDGEVRKVDKSTRKITLKHGEIKNLDMPPMTMVFRVKDTALLDKVKAGDKVRFTAEEIQGNLTLITIERAKK